MFTVVLSSASAEGTSDEQSIAAAAREVIKRFFIGNNFHMIDVEFII